VILLFLLVKLLFCRSELEFELSIAPLDDEEVVVEEGLRRPRLEDQGIVALAAACDRDAVIRHSVVCDAIIRDAAVYRQAVAFVRRRPGRRIVAVVLLLHLVVKFQLLLLLLVMLLLQKHLLLVVENLLLKLLLRRQLNDVESRRRIRR